MKQKKQKLIAVLIGLGLVLLLEVALRVFGVYEEAPGDPFIGFTSVGRLFVKDAGQYVINPTRSHLFNNESFSAEKEAGQKRIFCLGGSVVKGFPFGAETAWAEWLEYGLENLDKSAKYEVINAGGFAYASYRVKLIAGEIAQNYEPDLMVVMSGHNEFLEKRIYNEALLHGPLPQTRKALRRLRLFNMLRSIIIESDSDESKPVLGEKVTWDYVPRDDRQKKLTAMHFMANLEEMTALGVPVILMNLPVNLADWEPYHSRHRSDITDDELGKFEPAFETGKKFMAEGDYESAIEEFNKAIDIDGQYAQAHFLIGKCYLQTGKSVKALEHFWSAVDADDHPVRGFKHYNDIIKEAAQKESAHLADAIDAFNRLSRAGIPGYDLFVDHCHPVPIGSAGMAFSVMRAGAKSGIFNLESGWEAGFWKLVEEKIGSLPAEYWARGYYGAGYEASRYMKRPKDAKRCYELSLKHDPNFKKSIDALKALSKE